jgi:hypothetical protein
VAGVVFVATVEMNCTDSIVRGWPLTSSSKSAAVRVGTGFASRSTTFTSTRTISALVSNDGRGSCGGCDGVCCASAALVHTTLAASIAARSLLLAAVRGWPVI